MSLTPNEDDQNLPTSNKRRDLLTGAPAVAVATSAVWSQMTCNEVASAYPSSPTLDPARLSMEVPYSSLRDYKNLVLSNGMRVVLVRDTTQRTRCSAALSIGGAGQFADPPDLPGLAHLMEHMTLSTSTRTETKTRFFWQRSTATTPSDETPAEMDFEEYLSDRDGASNAFTAYDQVLFHFGVSTEFFAESLQRFARLFQADSIEAICRNEVALARETQRVCSEEDYSDPYTQAFYLVKSQMPVFHPFSLHSMGCEESLKDSPKRAGIDMSRRLIDFFQERYLPSQAILVVVSPSDFSTLEKWVSPFATTLSQGDAPTDAPYLPSSLRAAKPIQQLTYEFPDIRPLSQRSGRIVQNVLFTGKTDGPGEQLEKLSLEWPLDLDYEPTSNSVMVTAAQVAFVLAQILLRRGPGSLYGFLLRRGWVPNTSTNGFPRVSLPVDVSGFQLLKLEVTLTLDGYLNRSAVIGAIFESIGSVLATTTSRGRVNVAPGGVSKGLITQYCNMAKLNGYLLAPRPPDAVELAYDGQLYGVGGKGGIGPSWYRFPTPESDKGAIAKLQQATTSALTRMIDPANAIIVVTASSKAIGRSQQSIFGEKLPPIPQWQNEPVTGARYYRESNVLRLKGRLEQWVTARLDPDDSFLPPVFNPLVPSRIRPPRASALTLYRSTNPSLTSAQGKERLNQRRELLEDTWSRITAGTRSIVVDKNQEQSNPSALLREDAATSSPALLGRNWRLLQTNPSSFTARGIPLPRIPPEASCRSVFVLQLISSRPARANVRQAAHGALWKVSFEDSCADLAELGASGSLFYELSFNKFGLRICFLGISQNLPSYARRLTRRLVDHPTKLFQGNERLPASVKESTIGACNRARNLSQTRKREIIGQIRSASATDAALEGTAFFESCRGGYCFAQGDLLPKEALALLAELKNILRKVVPLRDRSDAATPELDDLIYRPNWKPRSPSSCSVPGVSLVSNACGRIPR